MSAAPVLPQTKTHRLPSGRNLTYAEYGDPSGFPVLVMHGSPGSRITRHPDDAATARLGVRVIIPDRPGIGGSDYVPARSIIDRVDDVLTLVNALGIDRFAVLGWSAGGPYALASAIREPERVQAIGVVCGFAPMDRPGATQGMSTEMRLFIPIVRRMPWLLKPIVASAAKQWARDPEKAFRKQFATGMSTADEAVLSDSAIRAVMQEGAAEAMRGGGPGAALEVRLLFARPWGFNLEDIKKNVWLWYGGADSMVPLQVSAYLARKLPVNDLTVYPDEGHMLFFTRWAEMLGTLARAGSRAP
jgi:pimeloyl-ACP methyl ester carboxylesterase